MKAEDASGGASSGSEASYDTDEEVARYNAKDATEGSDALVTAALAAYVQGRFSPKLTKVSSIDTGKKKLKMYFSTYFNLNIHVFCVFHLVTMFCLD